jgi:YbbR domain-containing protein
VVKFLDNIWLKVIALVVGLLLWFHVATEKVYNHRVQLPLTEIAVAEGLTLADNPPDSITVVVKAKGKQLLRSKWRQRGIKVNATQLSAGHHTLSLSAANTSLFDAGNLVTLDEVVSPASLSLNIDYKAEKTVKVLLDISTIPDEGYAVSSISDPEPPEATLIGARSLVRQCATVATEHKELTGLRNNLTLTLPLVPPPNYGMRLEPDSVTVSIEIVAAKTRVFENVPIVVYNAPRGKTVSTQPSSVQIELAGPPKDIDLLQPQALIASADFSSVDSSGSTPLKIDCPANFKVKRTSVDTVKIIVD